MLFNSFQFLIFFPIVVLLYYVVPDRVKNLWLLVSSYYFYMSWDPKYGLLLLFCTLVTYLSAMAIDGKKKNANRIFPAALLIVFAVLFYYKYFNFFVDNLTGLLSFAGISVRNRSFDIVLPVGISFFTFQAAGYLIDVYRGDTKAERNFINYALFVSFFPQLVAGPIERSRDILGQLKEKHGFDLQKGRDGFYLILWGYFLKMVIADRAAVIVDNIYGDYMNKGGAAIAMATVFFAFQLYCDFFGYSTIAMGSAKILGINLTDNFRAPFLSVSIGDYWTRWHISLYGWFRDYLYIPLGGSRKGKLRKYINIMIVFLVSGFWHGARWSFMIWGGLNGLYRIWEELTKSGRQKLYGILGINVNSFSHKLFRWIITFIFADFSLIFFRAQGARMAFSMIVHAIKNPNISSVLAGSQYTYGLDRGNFVLLILSIMLLMLSDYFKDRGICIREGIMHQDAWFRVLFVTATILFIIVCGVWGNAYDAKSFIYFRF